MLRKQAKLDMDQEIEIFWQANTEGLRDAILAHSQTIKDKLKKRFINSDHMPYAYPEIAREEFNLLQENGFIYICNPGISFNRSNLLKKSEDKLDRRNSLEQFVQLCGEDFIKRHVKDGVFSSKLDNVEFSLKENEDFFYGGFKN